MRSNAPTIKDIAKKIGVSISTVSRALRGMPEISEETRNKVLAYSKEIDYQPNMVATSLVKRNSHLIGVLVPNMDNFFATAVKGIDEAAMEAGYTVVISQSNESYGRELANTQRLINSQVEGLIVSLSSETQNVDHFRRIQKKDTPLVFFDRDAKGLSASKVLLDNELGGYIATEHLISQGCKRIAFLAAKNNLMISNSRKKGYEKALKAAGMEVYEDLVIYGEFDRDDAYKKTKKALTSKNPPDAIFAVSDRLAIGAYLAVKDLNLNIPQEVAIVGFNDDPITSLLSPTISTVSQPAFEMGKMAARLFIEQLSSGADYENRIEIFKPELMIRESSLRI